MKKIGLNLIVLLSLASALILLPALSAAPAGDAHKLLGAWRVDVQAVINSPEMQKILETYQEPNRKLKREEMESELYKETGNLRFEFTADTLVIRVTDKKLEERLTYKVLPNKKPGKKLYIELKDPNGVEKMTVLFTGARKLKMWNEARTVGKALYLIRPLTKTNVVIPEKTKARQ